jgi:hypothetical protein
MNAPLPPIESLAERLWFLLEKFDPTGQSDWEHLTDHQKEVYRATVRGLLCCRDLIGRALSETQAT